MFTLHSLLLQFICLTLGAILVIMAAQRIPSDTSAIGIGLASKKTLVILFALAAVSFALRFLILQAISTPVRYADYMSEGGTTGPHFMAANTTFFYVLSVVLMFGATIGAALMLFGRKPRTVLQQGN